MNDEDLDKFLNSAEVKQICEIAQLWDGGSVKGQLLALARQYHCLMLRFLKPEPVQMREVVLRDLETRSRKIWQPLRDEIWPKRPKSSVRRWLREIEECDHWNWLAVDSKSWGLIVDPFDISVEPRVAPIGVTFSAIAARYNSDRQTAEEYVRRGGRYIMPSLAMRLLGEGWSYSAATSFGSTKAEVYGRVPGSSSGDEYKSDVTVVVLPSGR